MHLAIYFYLKRISLILSLLIASGSLSAANNYYFYVQFANKNNTPYSLSTPSDFLSAKSISRRAAFGISCDSTDLPINPTYLSDIQNLEFKIHSKSKWMNGVSIILPDSSKMSQIRALPFVKWVQYTGRFDVAMLVLPSKAKNRITADYGAATNQINQLNGKALHDAGYKGTNIQIAVIDAGFLNVNTNPGFDSLRLQNRLLGTKDIINSTSNIFAEDSHGASVLSTMAGNIPGQFLGTAPDASYWLIRTEFAPTEYLVETDFWVAGLEYADSVGVDVVNSSLGYSVFDDPTMNFSYADMNGKVSRASKAATLAAQKGIIVVSSAGNEGGKTWNFIGSPADAEGIITVGGVTSTGAASTFSSFGPSSDLRVKPEICAQATDAVLIGMNGLPTTGNGTSFSSPIMAGTMACLLQAYKSQNSLCNLSTLFQAVFQSGSLYHAPSAQLGYGIPDFQTAMATLSIPNILQEANVNGYNITIDTNSTSIHIQLKNSRINPNNVLRIFALTGKLLIVKNLTEIETIISFSDFPSGIYAVNISGNGKATTKKFVVK